MYKKYKFEITLPLVTKIEIIAENEKNAREEALEVAAYNFPFDIDDWEEKELQARLLESIEIKIKNCPHCSSKNIDFTEEGGICADCHKWFEIE